MTTHPTSPPAALTLDAARVEDVMHRGVLSCSFETPLATVARMMAAHSVHCIVGLGDVTEDDTMLWGVVSDRDVLAAAATGDVELRDASGCARSELVTIAPGKSLRRAAEVMHEHGVTHLVVVEPDTDRPVGVLSTLDIAAVVGGVTRRREPQGASRVNQLMSTPVVSVAPDTSLKEAAAVLVQRGISGMPVVRDGVVVGVVSEADIVSLEQGARRPGRKGLLAWILRGDEVSQLGTATVADVMTTPAITVAPWQSAASTAVLMTKHGVKRLPVVDKERLVGIVSRADLVRAFARSDDEIEHEIRQHVIVEELWLSPGEIHVQVRGGAVTLSGKVDSLLNAELLADEARRVPGVVTVISKLTVASSDRA